MEKLVQHTKRVQLSPRHSLEVFFLRLDMALSEDVNVALGEVDAAPRLAVREEDHGAVVQQLLQLDVLSRTPEAKVKGPVEKYQLCFLMLAG